MHAATAARASSHSRVTAPQPVAHDRGMMPCIASRRPGAPCAVGRTDRPVCSTAGPLSLKLTSTVSAERKAHCAGGSAPTMRPRRRVACLERLRTPGPPEAGEDSESRVSES